MSALNEWHQKKHKRAVPEPESSSTGPDHQQTWTATLTLDGVTATGTGGSLKEARRRMAQDLLDQLGLGA